MGEGLSKMPMPLSLHRHLHRKRLDVGVLMAVRSAVGLGMLVLATPSQTQTIASNPVSNNRHDHWVQFPPKPVNATVPSSQNSGIKNDNWVRFSLQANPVSEQHQEKVATGTKGANQSTTASVSAAKSPGAGQELAPAPPSTMASIPADTAKSAQTAPSGHVIKPDESFKMTRNQLGNDFDVQSIQVYSANEMNQVLPNPFGATNKAGLKRNAAQTDGNVSGQVRQSWVEIPPSDICLQGSTLNPVFCGDGKADAPEVAPPKPSRPVPPTPSAAKEKESNNLILNPTTFAQLLLLRSLEIKYSHFSKEVAQEMARAEASLYETVMYGNARNTDTQRQRTTEEKAITMLSNNDYVLAEKARNVEMGIKQLLSTGAEVTIGARNFERANNIMQKYGTDQEVSSALVVTLKQPLLKGAGVNATEADKRVAQYESMIQAWQYHQQLLKVVGDGLSLFWQAHMAQQVAQLRQEMYQSADALVVDARQRVLAGKLPPRSIQELERFRLTRQADSERYQQNAKELQSRMINLLNFRRAEVPGLDLKTTRVEVASKQLSDRESNLSLALDNWAPFQISRLRVAQGRTRLAYADNQRLPALDFQYSYSSNGLAEGFRSAAALVNQNKYPDWWVGFNFEIGLNGGGKAKAQFQAQQLRVLQSETELQAVRLSLENDLTSKRDEIKSIQKEMEIYRADVKLKTVLRQSEWSRFQSGLGLVSTLLQADQDLLEARVRLLDAMGRLETTQLALHLANGTLLEAHSVQANLPQTHLH